MSPPDRSQMFGLVSPTGVRITGTSDIVPAHARVSAWYYDVLGRLQPDYEGYTDLDWDGQYTKTTLDEDLVVRDDNGDDWPLSQCRPEEEEPGNTPVENA